jgi:two-component system phosphate regulon sensor histidine kinase PhoR
MPGVFSFRAKLLISFIAVILVALVPPAWFARHTFTTELTESAKESARRDLEMVSLLLAEEGSFQDAGGLSEWIGGMSRRLDVRLGYYDLDGRLLSDPADMGMTGVDPRALLDGDEIPRGGIGADIHYSAELERELLYTAMRAPEISGAPPGYLVLAMPMGDLENRLSTLSRNMLIILGVALALAFILSFVLIRNLSSSISGMVAVAKSIGEGNFSRRLRFYPGQEFQKLADSINTMAQSIQSHVDTITWQKQQLEAVLNGMREGVMVLDRRGRISTGNAALGRLFPGLDKSTGKRPLEVIMSPELQEACDQALKAGGQESFSLQIEPAPEHVLDVNIVSLSGEGHGLGAIVVFHDISEIKRLERVRRDFVANVSHELRTPLTTVKGYAETLVNDPSAPAEIIKNFLEVILKNADHMAKMIEDLLSLSRLEGGKENFNINTVNAANALSEAYRSCSTLAEKKGIVLEQVFSESRILVRADFDRLVQVFRNLLENAFKYAPENSRVEVAVEPESDGHTVFAVSDEGPGIPRGDQERIFERFYRVEKHRARSGGASSGLGLAICKHIVERQGGRIRVESPGKGGKGSTFYFSIPKADGNDLNQELQAEHEMHN